MTRRTVTEWILKAIVVIVAVFLLAIGAVHKHKVYDPDSEESFGLVTFSRIDEMEMIEDTTFGGVTRKLEKLYFTYDRSAPRGKRACPT